MARGNKPLVSIGMPVYNGERYLRDALDSLLAQDYKNFELIISDNASTDETARICQEYRAKDVRISYSRNDQNLGTSANFKRVLDSARGKYFMWAAADDKWLPTFVSALVDELESDLGAGVAMCAINRVKEDGALLDQVRYLDLLGARRTKWLSQAMDLAAGKPHHLYVYGLYRSEIIKAAFHGFPKVAMGDRLFVCGLALATRFAYLDQVLHIRRTHGQPMAEKYAGEEIGRFWADPWAYFKLVAAVGPYLMRSKTIPLQRKIYIPLVVMRFAWSHRKRIRRAIWTRIAAWFMEPTRRRV